MELGVRLRRRQAVLRGKLRMGQVDRRVRALAGRVVVDDLEILADRALAEVSLALPGDLDGDPRDLQRVELRRQERVERKDPEFSAGGCRGFTAPWGVLGMAAPAGSGGTGPSGSPPGATTVALNPAPSSTGAFKTGTP